MHGRTHDVAVRGVESYRQLWLRWKQPHDHSEEQGPYRAADLEGMASERVGGRVSPSAEAASSMLHSDESQLPLLSALGMSLRSMHDDTLLEANAAAAEAATLAANAAVRVRSDAADAGLLPSKSPGSHTSGGHFTQMDGNDVGHRWPTRLPRSGKLDDYC